jgi:hypothetical protein
MSAIIDDCGPAFPFWELNSAKGTRFTIEGGMTIRDYFAASAISGRFMFGFSEDVIARSAYELADAMIAERNKQREAE